MAKSDNFLLNGALVYFQYADPRRIGGIDAGDLTMTLEEGDAWNASDMSARRWRTEGRFYSPYPIGKPATFAFTIERDPATFPVWGSRREDKVTFLQGFNGGKSRPSFWLETLGLTTNVFLNSEVGDTKEPIPLDVPLYGRVRWVQEVEWKQDGSIDLALYADRRLVFERTGFRAERAGGFKDAHGKWGLYVSRKQVMEPIPTLQVRVGDFSIHEGEAVGADFSGGAFPRFWAAAHLNADDAAPLPSVDGPGPEPVPPVDPVTPVEPVPEPVEPTPVEPEPEPASPAPAPAVPVPRALVEWVDSIENGTRDVASELRRGKHGHADLAEAARDALTALLVALKAAR